MALIKERFQSANVTVLGHFNPAILKHAFLASECGLVDLGEPIMSSPLEAVVVVREITYSKLRWFMDLGRMVVEDTEIDRIDSLRSPGLVVKYLDVLKYTPVTVAGINVNGIFEVSNLQALWHNLGSAPRLREAVERFGGIEAEITSKFALSRAGEMTPSEFTLTYRNPQDARVLLRVSTPPIGNAINAQYNWEIRGLDIDRSKIELLASQYQQVARDFSQLMENLSQEAWQ